MDTKNLVEKHLESSEHARRRFKRWRIALIIIAVLVLGTVGWIGFNAFHVLGKISQAPNPFKGFFKSPPQLAGQAEGRTNFLILGRGGANHAGGQLTDTIIFISYNWADKKMALVSIPRDLYVPIARDGGKNKVNYAYAYGAQNFKNDPNAGPGVTAETISSILDQPVHYWTVVDFVGFKKLVDALGGVEVNVEKTIDDPYYPAEYFQGDQYVKTEDYERFTLSAGEQALDGETALKFARSRETTSDFDRAGRQQILISAIKNKAVSVGVLGNPKKVVELLGVLGDHVRTNLSVAEMETVVSLARDIDTSKIITCVLDNKDKGFLTNLSAAGGYYLTPKDGSFSKIQEYVKNIFSEGVAVEEPSETAQAPSKLPEASARGQVLGAISTTALVSIQNATGEPGTARQFSEILQTVGYSIYALTTAPKTLEETLIYVYAPAEDSAVTENLQRALPQAKVIRYPDPDSPVDYRVILGQDYIL